MICSTWNYLPPVFAAQANRLCKFWKNFARGPRPGDKIPWATFDTNSLHSDLSERLRESVPRGTFRPAIPSLESRIRMQDSPGSL